MIRCPNCKRSFPAKIRPRVLTQSQVIFAPEVLNPPAEKPVPAVEPLEIAQPAAAVAEADAPSGSVPTPAVSQADGLPAEEVIAEAHTVEPAKDGAMVVNAVADDVFPFADEDVETSEKTGEQRDAEPDEPLPVPTEIAEIASLEAGDQAMVLGQVDTVIGDEDGSQAVIGVEQETDKDAE